MNDKQRVRISKYLSKHLRHDPERLGLTLEPGGWVDVGELLAACAADGFPITRDELDEIVETSDKRRFSFDETESRIRANQGHSVEVDLQLAPTTPPDQLFHGTAEHFVPGILGDGLKRMSRHHVHLSTTTETARKVGARHGKPVVLVVDAAAMHRDGILFYVSDNGVWLVDEVPARYLRLLE
jgi:putative RNA 2'-phosphotransferase